MYSEDRVGEFDSGLPPPAVEQFDLHRGPEALHQGVVQAVADGAEGRQEAGGADLLAEHLRGELGRFNRSMQHRVVEGSVVAPRRPQLASSSRGSCGADC